MTKFSNFSLLTFCTISLLSCSGLKRHPNFQSKNPSPAIETADLNGQELFLKRPKSGEYTHELAEANADDVEITKETGSVAIDDELPGSESDEIPYARNFLKNKKTKRMQFWVDYFTKKNRDRFQRFINNGEEYRHHIEKVFQQYGLPKELYFVGLIESGYYLGAKSHASAVGPWQFIRATGRRYGMKVNHEIDERQDLFKSTHAAAQYFRDLHKIFSSWELALAAYNAGENGMIRRIIKHGTRDFYKLSQNKHIPSETINYVPKVLAAMHILKNAKEYGFNIPTKQQRLFDLTELTPVKKNVPLKVIAQRLQVDPRLLKKLNPELKRGKTPFNFAGTYMLRVPKAQYAHNLIDLKNVEIAATNTNPKIGRPESRKELNRRTASMNYTGSKFHKVKKGETLLSISRKYKISAKEIASYNDLNSWKSKVKVGEKLSLVEQKLTASSPKVKITNKPIIYKVTKGDNLKEISEMFNSPINKIKKANGLKKGQILVGQKLVLPNTQKAIYTVQHGDHLTKVAKDFNLPIDTLVKLNSLKRKVIYPGQKIIVNMD
jgi:membrane-bound lytic murein transglycosylase D